MALKRLKSGPLKKGWDMKIKVLLLALATGGCALGSAFGPIVTPFTSGDGRQAYQIHCGGVAMSMATCQTKARELCGGNFTETNRSVTSRDDTVTENRSIEVICATSQQTPSPSH